MDLALEKNKKNESPGVRFIDYSRYTYLLTQEEYYDVMQLKETLGITESLAVASVLTCGLQSIQERTKFITNNSWNSSARWDEEECLIYWQQPSF